MHTLTLTANSIVSSSLLGCQTSGAVVARVALIPGIHTSICDGPPDSNKNFMKPNSCSIEEAL